MMRVAALLAVLMTSALVAAPAQAALSLGISTPLSPLSITPGTTATGTTGVLVTPDLLSPAWTLTISDSAGNDGHLERGAIGCSGVEPQTVNRLTAKATGTLGTTASAGTKTVSNTSQTLATGVGVDTVKVTFSLSVLASEVLSTGCTMSTTVTYSVQ